MPIGSGGYPTSYRGRNNLGSRMVGPRHVPTPGGHGFRLTEAQRTSGYHTPPPAMSMGEVVPYQSGPKGAVSAPKAATRGGIEAYHPAGGTKPSNYPASRAAGTWNGRTGGYGKPSALMAMKLLGRMLPAQFRGPLLLGELVLRAADLLERSKGEWMITADGEVIYNHPANAELLEKCPGIPVTWGPVWFDGDCSGSAVDMPTWLDMPSFLEAGGWVFWRYHNQTGIDVFGRSVYNKAEVWVDRTGGMPGEMTTEAPVVQPIRMAMPAPQVGMRGPTVSSRTREDVKDPFPRKDEKKKGLAQRGFALAVRAYDKADEVGQAIDIIWGSMEGPCKGKAAGKNRGQKAMDIARCAGTINLSKMVVGLAANHLQDMVIGRIHALGSQPIRGPNAPRAGAGPAL